MIYFTVYGFVFLYLHIIPVGHCFTWASRRDTSTVLGPASGANDRIVNHDVWKNKLYSENFLKSTFIFCLPYFHIHQICSKTWSPICCQKILARYYTILVTNLFLLKEDTVIP